jgi:hypothetical protein
MRSALLAVAFASVGTMLSGCCCRRPCGESPLTASTVQTETLYAVAHERMYVSRDRGVTWKPTGEAVARPSLYTKSSGGLFESHDTGKTWVSVPGAR